MAKKIVRKASNRISGKKAGNKERRNSFNLETLRPPRGSRKRKVRVGLTAMLPF